MKKIFSFAIIVLAIFTFVGCGQQAQEVNVPVKDIVENIKSQMAEDMIADGAKEESFKDGKLPGYMETDLTAEEAQGPLVELFNTEDIEEGIILQQMINIKSDVIVVVKAKNESNIESIKASLEKIKETQENIWSQYLPDQYEKVKNNITLVQGKYLVYITYDSPEKLEEIFVNALK